MNTDKRIIQVDVPHDIDWEYELPLEKLEEDIKQLRSKGATHLEIEAYEHYDSAYIKYRAFYKREETVEDVLARLNKDKAWKDKRIKELENQLARLKEEE